MIRKRREEDKRRKEWEGKNRINERNEKGKEKRERTGEREDMRREGTRI